MIYIEKGLEVLDWEKLEDALELLRPYEENVVTVKCPYCGGRVKLPIVAREADIEAFRELIRMAEEYLRERDLLGKILERIAEKKQ